MKTTIDEIERLTKDATAGSLYLTVQALEDDVYGRINLKTDITTEDIQRFFNREDDNLSISEKLDELRDKHGIRSSIMQQLAAMIGDSKTMNKLADLQRMKALASDGSKKTLIYGSSKRDFIEENK